MYINDSDIYVDEEKVFYLTVHNENILMFIIHSI